MDGAAMAKIDTSVRSSCEKMGKLDAGFVDGVLAMRGVWSLCREKKNSRARKKEMGQDRDAEGKIQGCCATVGPSDMRA
jgi:hypothetical protein